MPNLHRAVYFPVQLADGTTHVVGPGDKVIRSFEDPDTITRWKKAKGHAASLNARLHLERERTKVRRRWLLIVILIAPMIGDMLAGGALSREIVAWLTR